MRRFGAIAAALVLAACGSGDDDGSDAVTFPCRLDADPAPIDLVWTNPRDDQVVLDLAHRWTERGAGDVEVRQLVGFFDGGIAMLDPDPPVLAQVSYSMVPTLVAAGAIRPMGDCFAAAGVEYDEMLASAVARSTWDGIRYGAPANIDTVLFLYDRADFQRAGLDPDRPPRTIAEVHDAAIALRDRAAMPQPVAWDFPHSAIFGVDVASDDARAAASAWVDLARDGLLYRLPPGETLPPIGSGRAAMQLIEPHGLWNYGRAIADGQAPDADLGVALLPGAAGGVAPVGGGVWVVSARATDAEAAAAARFIAWMEASSLQAELHVRADYLPSSVAAIEEAQVRELWAEIPLMREAWELVAEHGVAVEGWETVMGSYTTISRLMEIAHDGEPFDEVWDRAVELVSRAEERQRRAPEELVRCVQEHVEDREPVLAACV